MRTQDEIRARLDTVRASHLDFLGKRQEVLVQTLDYEHIKDLLTDPDPEKWGDPQTPWETSAAAGEYLAFAVEKAIDHRGLSANRSIDAFTEYLWLLTDDDTCRKFDEVRYAPYGMPKLKFAAEALGFTEAFDAMGKEYGVEMARMAAGLSCSDNCGECFS
jgi:hypothetical protein